jgi:K+ transport systems, NAD-binding component
MKFCIIGLGRFGYQVAIVLAENGMEVLAIDYNDTIVASIRDKVTQAICMKVTDEESLRSIGVDEMDTVIVAMGENFAESILLTAILKKLGTKKIIARAANEIHKDILNLVGADRVVLPEKEIGIRLADNLSSPFTDLTRLTKSFSISLISAPNRFIGKKLHDLDLFNHYRVHCIGIKIGDDTINPAEPSYIITAKDRLVFAGETDDLEKVAAL